MADAATELKPAQVVLLVDSDQKKSMRNTFVFWEAVAFGLGIYVGKKLYEGKDK